MLIQQLFNKGYHNFVRYLFLQNFLSGKNVLLSSADIGQIKFLKQLGVDNILVVDENEENINKAREFCDGLANVNYLLKDSFISQPITDFDAVIIPQIESQSNLWDWLNIVTKCLNNEGILIAGIHNIKSEVNPEINQNINNIEPHDFHQKLYNYFPYVYMRTQDLLFAYTLISLEDELAVNFDSSFSDDEIPLSFVYIASHKPIDIDTMSIIQLPNNLLSIPNEFYNQMESSKVELEGKDAIIESIKQEYEKLLHDFDEYKKEYGNKIVEIKSLEQNIIALQQKNSEEHDKFVEAKLSFEAEKKRALSLEKDLEIARRISLIKEQEQPQDDNSEKLKDAEIKIKELEIIVNNYKNTVERMENEKLFMEAKIKGLQFSKNELEVQLKSVQIQSNNSEALRKSIEQYNTRIKIMEQEREKILSEKENMKKDIEYIKEDSSESVLRLENKLEQKTEENLENERKIDHYKKLTEDLVVQLQKNILTDKDLTQDVILLEARLVSSLSLLDNLLAEVDKLNRELNENKKQLEFMDKIKQNSDELEHKIKKAEENIILLSEQENQRISKNVEEQIEIKKLSSFLENDLKNMMSLYTNQLTNSYNKIIDLEKQIIDLKTELIEKTSSNKNQENYTKYEERIRELERLLDERKNVVEKITTEKEQILNEKIILTNQFEAIKEEYGKRKVNFDTLEENFAIKLEEKEQEIKLKEEKVAELEYNISNYQEIITDLENKIVNLSDQIGRSNLQLDDITKKKEEELLYQLNILTNELEKKESEVRNIILMLGSHPEEVLDKLEELSSENKELNEMLEESKNKLMNIEQSSGQIYLKQLEGIIKNLTDERDSFKEINSKIKNENEYLNGRITFLVTELEGIEAGYKFRCSELERDYLILSSKLKNNSEEIKEVDQILEEIENYIEKSESAYESICNVAKNYKEENETIKSELDYTRSELAQLHCSLEALEWEKKSLSNNQNNQEEVNTHKYDEQIDKLKIKITELVNSIAEKESTLLVINSHLDDYKKRIETLKLRINQLTEVIEESLIRGNQEDVKSLMTEKVGEIKRLLVSLS